MQIGQPLVQRKIKVSTWVYPDDYKCDDVKKDKNTEVAKHIYEKLKEQPRSDIKFGNLKEKEIIKEIILLLENSEIKLDVKSYKELLSTFIMHISLKNLPKVKKRLNKKLKKLKKFEEKQYSNIIKINGVKKIGNNYDAEKIYADANEVITDYGNLTALRAAVRNYDKSTS